MPTSILKKENKGPKVIVALDYSSKVEALEIVSKLDPELCRLKVGKQLFTATGNTFVSHLVNLGFDVFLDLKFHDIPNTVEHACEAATDLGVWMLNVHALGGQKMMVAARAGIHKGGGVRPLLIAVTLLTSMGDSDLRQVGINSSVLDTVKSLAALAAESGLDGVVCSAQETSVLRQQFGDDFSLVTPGIRPRGSAADDQVRVVTPTNALNNGSDYLVIGRPITLAKDPIGMLIAINKEIAEIT